MKIIKNYLPKESYIKIKETLMSDNFPWFFNENVLSEEDQKDQKSIYQFTHTFYKNNTPWSKYYEILDPILNILNPLTILRIKSNLNTQTEKIEETGLHIDHEDDRFKSAVFFLNTCDGYCKIIDEKVLSEDNKMVLFNSNIKHTGSTTTNQKRRVLINFIYLPRV